MAVIFQVQLLWVAMQFSGPPTSNTTRRHNSENLDLKKKTYIFIPFMYFSQFSCSFWTGHRNNIKITLRFVMSMLLRYFMPLLHFSKRILK
jgi:hypothetical protein